MTRSKVQNRSTKHDETVKEIPLACADEREAVEFMERKRWGDSPSCPRCGCLSVYQMKDSKTGERQADYRWRCRDCKGQYTVRIGTVFEDSRIELRHWCYGFWRAATSKKGVSALEIHRQTGLSYKSALFMLHRIRFAMANSVSGPLDGPVEVDETYIGGKPRYKGTRKPGRGTSKAQVMAMVERQGRVKAQPVRRVGTNTLKKMIEESVAITATIISDENPEYRGIGPHFAGGHHTVNHRAREYARGQINSNTVEGFFSILKRGLHGVYHSVSTEHLHRYISEYEFRYNYRELEDGDRIVAAIKASEGKRLRYRDSVKAIVN